MDANECRQERFSTRTLGFFVLAFSMLLFLVGLVILPVFGFVFAIPILILAVLMIAAPESKACRLIRGGLRAKG